MVFKGQYVRFKAPTILVRLGVKLNSLFSWFLGGPICGSTNESWRRVRFGLQLIQSGLAVNVQKKVLILD
jgi:hypothetical protein